MRKKALAIAMCLSITPGFVFAGIPTIDVVGNTQRLLGHIEDIASFVEQIEHMKNTLEATRKQFDSLNGVRGMASLLNNPATRQYLPKEASEIYSLSQKSYKGSHGGLSASIQSLKSAAAILNKSDFKNENIGGMVDSNQSALATMQAQAEAAYTAAGKRFEDLQQLVETVDLANDPKAAMDLQNRIQAEQAMLQNENIKLGMMRQLAEVQEKIGNQRKQELSTTVGSPVEFSGY